MQYHTNASLAEMPVRKGRIAAHWTNRRWRKNARSTISFLWLALANMENLRRQWDEERRDLEASPDLLLLLETDYSRDFAKVADLKMDSVVATVEQVASRMDNRLVVCGYRLGSVSGRRSRWPNWRGCGPALRPGLTGDGGAVPSLRNWR